MSSKRQLGLLTRVEVAQRVAEGAIVLQPVGSLEQHGDHLPIATDTLLADYVCRQVAEQVAESYDLLVAPAIWTGFSPHHVRFGATVSLSAETFIRFVTEVVRGIALWAPRVVLVNGHGGNRGPLVTVALETGCPLVNYWELAVTRLAELFPVDASIGHAGEAETGMMQAAYPEFVGTPSPSFERPADAELLFPDMGASGVLGDPLAAQEGAGAEFLKTVTANLADRLDRLVLQEPKEP